MQMPFDTKEKISALNQRKKNISQERYATSPFIPLHKLPSSIHLSTLHIASTFIQRTSFFSSNHGQSSRTCTLDQ